MKIIAAACLSLFALAACSPQGTINASALQGVMEPVLDRHDAYVSADDSLLDFQKETYLRSSELIREMVRSASAP